MNGLSQSRIRMLDVALVLWIVLWIVAGVLVKRDIDRAGSLSASVVDNARTIEQTGTAIRRLQSVPFVGGSIGGLGREIETRARAARLQSETSASAIANAGTWMGLATAMVPTLQVLFFYVPQRLVRRRDRRAVTTAMRERGRDVDEYLARRALVVLPPATVLQATSDPQGDVDGGRFKGLADAQLAFLGLRRN